MYDSLPPNYEQSNQVKTIVASKFCIENVPYNKFKVVRNLKTDEELFRFEANNIYKEFHIFNKSNVRLVTFKEIKLDVMYSTLSISFHNEKTPLNYNSANVQIKLGNYTKLILKDLNENEHVYKLKEHEFRLMKEDKVSLYYSNLINKKKLIGNVVVNVKGESKNLAVFNLEIHADKQLETLILGLVLINVSLKERRNVFKKERGISQMFKIRGVAA